MNCKYLIRRFLPKLLKLLFSYLWYLCHPPVTGAKAHRHHLPLASNTWCNSSCQYFFYYIIISIYQKIYIFSRKHSDTLPLQCDKCPYTTPNKQTLKKHNNRLHRNTDEHVTFRSVDQSVYQQVSSVEQSCEQPVTGLDPLPREHLTILPGVEHVTGILSPDQLVTEHVTRDLTGVEIHQLENGSTVLVSNSDTGGDLQQNTFVHQVRMYQISHINKVTSQVRESGDQLRMGSLAIV